MLSFDMIRFYEERLAWSGICIEIFKNTFDELEFRLNKKLNIEDIIDKIEEIDNEEIISVKYKQTDTSNCRIRIYRFQGKIMLSKHTFTIQMNKKDSPQNLVLSCQGAYEALGQQGIPKMLE